MSTLPFSTPAQECIDRAIYAFGTGEIFKRRSETYRRRLNYLAFLGLAGFVVIGAVIVAFGTEFTYLNWIIATAGIVAVLQALYSLWALTARWPDHLEYSMTSAADNFQLATNFAELARDSLSPKPDFDERLAALKASDNARRNSDSNRGITDKELRFGHRAGLRHYQRACAGCKSVPQSMKSSDCPVCGQF
jgi:mobilome CxxCx(11)CxxC protein